MYKLKCKCWQQCTAKGTSTLLMETCLQILESSLLKSVCCNHNSSLEKLPHVYKELCTPELFLIMSIDEEDRYIVLYSRDDIL